MIKVNGISLDQDVWRIILWWDDLSLFSMLRLCVIGFMALYKSAFKFSFLPFTWMIFFVGLLYLRRCLIVKLIFFTFPRKLDPFFKNLYFYI